jgi:hypothetical protein
MKFFFTQTEHEDQMWGSDGSDWAIQMRNEILQCEDAPHEMVDSPEEADITVFWEPHQGSQIIWAPRLRAHPLIYEFPNKAFVVATEDLPLGFLPGLYPLNTGTTFPVSRNNLTGIPVTGIFFENSAVRVQDITDGTSQTVCVSETIVSDGVPGVWDGVSQTNGFVQALGGDDKSSGPQLINYPVDCSGSGLKLNMTRGVIWIYGAPGHSMYNHVRSPNDRGVDCRGGLPHSSDTNFWWDRLSHNVTAHSRHPGGVQTLRCDGSVLFVKNSVSVMVWSSLGSRNGQEILSSDAF